MNRYRFLKDQHIHELDGKALTGTSSVSKVISAGGALSWWASEKCCEKLGWLHPKKALSGERISNASPILNNIKKMDIKEYLALLDEAYKNHSVRLKESAVKGTDLHAELERYINDMINNKNYQCYDIKIKPFTDWANKNVKKFLWSEKYSYSEKLWVGGISDGGALLNNGSIALIDFKSAKAVYTSHYIQAAGYCIQIEENGLYDIDGNFIMKLDKPIDKLIVVAFGADVVIPKENDVDIIEYKRGFEAALYLYRIMGMEK